MSLPDQELGELARCILVFDISNGLPTSVFFDITIIGVQLNSTPYLAPPIINAEIWEIETLEKFEDVKLPSCSNLEIPLLRASSDGLSNSLLRQSFDGHRMASEEARRVEDVGLCS